MNGLTPIPATYDYRLVALSVVIAILASYAALDLAGRVTATRGRARLAWLMGGALAMGSGIWSMHYTGMLAFRLPIRVSYHVPTVALSLLAAILASSIALYVVSRERMTPLHVAAGSFLMGAGIAGMHYIGMAAMRLAAMHHYQRGLWALSVVLAVVISFVGLLLIAYVRDENRRWKSKVAIAHLSEYAQRPLLERQPRHGSHLWLRFPRGDDRQHHRHFAAALCRAQTPPGVHARHGPARKRTEL